ncbi:transcriptional regulator, NifA, Fis Family [Spirochaeta thermophila DSM 6578]|uniref:Nif-specific regulatory protein n=1 Tax=Winmispira thermophila (strain ATCC 700085 / DSM 6578 / Z-1203) TaxID=869211 RepID=G0GBN3_WINT7|nr:nif-specific transcriptional activator NifA [Spirochaeta thermophila]AEJ61111.1 transcriptional regulator, NifA, Fis Family [Spirochaeta thermophila DSM 6578]
MERQLALLEKKVGELSLLFEVSQLLAQTIDVREVLQPVLRLIAEQLGMNRGTITLLNRNTGEIVIEEAYGLSESQKLRGRYRIGEGVTGKVVQSGRPIVIPRISESREFLNRTGSRQKPQSGDLSFFCVPIKVGNEVVGTLSADRDYDPDLNLDDEARLLTILASLIAQAVKLKQELVEERERLMEENARLHEELKEHFRPANIIGTSKAMQDVFDMIARVSRSEATVLIRGESGTGKELIAQAIHYNSLRADKPFIRVNCAALPETLIESELFGHEKGAFTGALTRRKGRFELAHEGTIFLDEIGDLSPQVQVKLLRVLQEKEFERVGGSETIRVNVRVLAATNRNLEELMAQGKFREDLYYRLNVFPIHVPPLRERRSDILLLADHFIEKYAKQNNKHIHRISTPAINLLMSYHWPGNVRELENCIERAVLLSTDGVIHSYHLPPTLQSAESTQTEFKGTLKEALENLERELIIDALKTCRGNMSKAAEMLGITERIMGLRVRKYRINPKAFRPRTKVSTKM